MNKSESNKIARKHRKFMMQAYQLAEQAKEEDEVPIGSLVVHKDTIIGKGYNQVEKLNDATAHAEMLALSAASSTLGSKYLPECTLYATLEPCPMCATAAVWTKLDRIVFGAADAESGGCGSIFNLTRNSSLNHKVNIIQGILERECEQILQSFFERKRET